MILNRHVHSVPLASYCGVHYYSVILRSSVGSISLHEYYYLFIVLVVSVLVVVLVVVVVVVAVAAYQVYCFGNIIFQLLNNFYTSLLLKCQLPIQK